MSNIVQIIDKADRMIDQMTLGTSEVTGKWLVLAIRRIMDTTGNYIICNRLQLKFAERCRAFWNCFDEVMN